MSSSAYRDTLHTAYTRDGITGHGEGAPIVRYHEDARGRAEGRGIGARSAARGRPDAVLQDHGRGLRARAGRVGRQGRHRYRADGLGGPEAGHSALRYFGLDPRDTPLTTFSIGIDTPEITRQKTREAADYPVLKVKVGLATDEPTIEAVRSVTKKPLRVDANEGWKDKEEAVRKINWLEKHGRGVHRAAHARRNDRGDALGAQPRPHPHHRRRSLPARRPTFPS